jgi:hypothetical protein
VLQKPEKWQLTRPGKLSHFAIKKDPPFSLAKSTISIAMFNSYVSHCQRVQSGNDLADPPPCHQQFAIKKPWPIGKKHGLYLAIKWWIFP